MGPSGKQYFGITLILIGAIVGINDDLVWLGACIAGVGVVLVYLGGHSDDYHSGKS